MNQQTKTAIQSAEQDLEKDKQEALKKQIYDYLKGELDAVEGIESQMRKLNEQKKAHEENIKNLKQGNLKAIEERNKSFGWTVQGQLSVTPFIGYSQIAAQASSQSSYAFYTNNVAGTTITTSNGKLFVF